MVFIEAVNYTFSRRAIVTIYEFQNLALMNDILKKKRIRKFGLIRVYCWLAVDYCFLTTEQMLLKL